MRILHTVLGGPPPRPKAPENDLPSATPQQGKRPQAGTPARSPYVCL